MPPSIHEVPRPEATPPQPRFIARRDRPEFLPAESPSASWPRSSRARSPLVLPPSNSSSCRTTSNPTPIPLPTSSRRTSPTSPSLTSGLSPKSTPGDFGAYREAVGQEYAILQGTTGRSDRLAIVYDPRVLTVLGDAVKLSDAGGSRHPLMARFRAADSDAELVVVANHLQRGNAQTRQAQAQWLNGWAASITDVETPQPSSFLEASTSTSNRTTKPTTAPTISSSKATSSTGSGHYASIRTLVRPREQVATPAIRASSISSS